MYFKILNKNKLQINLNSLFTHFINAWYTIRDYLY
jgi:hypothetical protein